MSSRNVIDLRKAARARAHARGPMLPFGRTTRRVSPLKTRKRRMRAALALACIVAVGGIAYAIHYVSYLPRFTIQRISIDGVHDMPEEILRLYAESVLHDGSYGYFARDNIFLYPRDALAAGVAASFPRIRAASVTRPSLLSTDIVLAVEERMPYALWCRDAQMYATSALECFVLDEEGVIFAPREIADGPSSPYVFTGGVELSSRLIGETFVPGRMEEIVALLDRLRESGYTPTGAHVENEQDYTVPLVGAPLLKISFGTDAATTMRNLALILASDALQGREDIEYIDLRFGNRVYYKLREESEQE